MVDSLEPILSACIAPFPREEVSQPRDNWIKVVRQVSTDTARAARSGQEMLHLIAERLLLQKVAAERILNAAGLRCKHAPSNPWVAILEECGRDFVEQCAIIVESSNRGSSHELASRLLGCAVKLAEALGRTGPLLASFEVELATVGDRVVQLELLYAALLRQVEHLANDAPVLKAKADEAERARMELRVECRDAQQAFREECRELRRDLRTSEKRRLSAECSLTELRRELRAPHRQSAFARSARSATPPPTCRQCCRDAQVVPFSTTVTTDLPLAVARFAPPSFVANISGSLSAVAGPTRGASANASHRTCVGIRQKTRSRGDESAVIRASSPVENINAKATHSHLRATTGKCDSISPTVAEDGSSVDDTESTNTALGVCDRAGAVPGRTAPASDADHVETALELAPASTEVSPLVLGAIWVQALPHTDPLAASLEAAFSHLAALVREALAWYTSLPSPRGEGSVPSGRVAPAVGLQWVAAGVAQWAERELVEIDRSLAASIGQSASHVALLSSLCLTPKGLP
eukprot:TRINITY_DN17342_c0_g1_i1.p1 TRINITY_DN17342_c0_g1~~TRINITY_DN17342_c0_g1_i1.p1  ORF type:complete len:524 (+),score=72.73 TRINITY_DN17342_c0_g1_i1:82-1653(+)